MASTSRRVTVRLFAAIATAVAGLWLTGACDSSLDIGEPSTRALEDGVTAGIGRNHSFEITGSITEAGLIRHLDLRVDRMGAEQMVLTGDHFNLEAIITDGHSYFRGREFLAQHAAGDAGSVSLLNQAGDSWWRGSGQETPKLIALVDAESFRSNFLGPAVTSRSDHLSVEGVAAVRLMGPRAEVLIARDEPHRLLALRMRNGATVDGIVATDLRYGNYGGVPAIGPPEGAVNFRDFSTLPPLFTVEMVDGSACGSPCVVSARVRNLGGANAPGAASKIAFKLSDPASGRVYGSCVGEVPSGVRYDSTELVSCTMSIPSGGEPNGATLTATPGG